MALPCGVVCFASTICCLLFMAASYGEHCLFHLYSLTRQRIEWLAFRSCGAPRGGSCLHQVHVCYMCVTCVTCVNNRDKASRPAWPAR